MSDRRSAERDFDALYRAQAPRVVHLIYASWVQSWARVRSPVEA